MISRRGSRGSVSLLTRNSIATDDVWILTRKRGKRFHKRWYKSSIHLALGDSALSASSIYFRLPPSRMNRPIIRSDPERRRFLRREYTWLTESTRITFLATLLFTAGQAGMPDLSRLLLHRHANVSHDASGHTPGDAVVVPDAWTACNHGRFARSPRIIVQIITARRFPMIMYTYVAYIVASD